MNQILPRSARAALFVGAAFLATPAFAQAGQTVTPPAVVPTVPQAQQAAPPPSQVTPPPVTQAAPTPRMAPASPVVQGTPPEPEPQAQPAARAEAAPRPERRAARPAPRAAAPAEPAAEAPAPVAAAPAPAPVPETAPAAPAAAPVADTAPVEEAAPAEPAQESGWGIWPWVAGGLLVALAAIAFLMTRRRREEDDYAEAYYEEPAASAPPAVDPVMAAPVAAAPVVAERPVLTPRHEPEVAPRVVPAMADSDVEIAHPVVAAEDASVATAAAEDLAGVTDTTAPVSHRPWIELGMRPVRAGTMADEALVEIELIVGNAGDMAAEDVRISTFMIPGGRATSEMEQLLIERAEESVVPPVTIAPGDGKTIEATLAAPRAEVAAQGESFSPVVVADARYRLPDGSEGRTSATFRIGLTEEGATRLEPIGLDRRGMHENVMAELEGAPARA